MDKQNAFRSLPREVPGYRATVERRTDWKEIHRSAGETQNRRQGLRCMDCGVPFCQGDTGCPLGNEIPRWNELVAAGNWSDALARLHATNNFPEFTGRLCPAPCESACVLGLHSESVAIKSIEWAIVERGFERGWITPQKAAESTGKKIAIVGSGPAGLAAAQELARLGHSVTVFEKASRPGGLLRYGIPDFKIEKWRIDRRLHQLEAEGVVFRTSSALGRDFTLTDLRTKFHAVGLAVGAEQPRDLQAPGRELEGIHFAMDYLVGRNRLQSGETRQGTLSARGKNVVILGGGDTGSDCLGTALREGARSVQQFELLPRPPLVRDSATPWPLWPLVLRSSHAHEEGGTREWSLSTKRFHGSRGRVEKLVAERIRWQGGRFERSGEADLEFPADLVILAMGFTGIRTQLFAEHELALDGRGNISADERFRTSAPGVFAAGDAKRGASLIVWAIAEGRKMAAAMHQCLRNPS
ncbi:MAG TPA: glutamate synthase subunit beta [Bdellovibrionota bacterium]|jgi:glutamate synthase (NADPH/NADH) small chain